MFLIIDAFGLILAAALACAVWGPGVWRWIAMQLGIQPPPEEQPGHFGLD
jgi:hypothetical protein